MISKNVTDQPVFRTVAAAFNEWMREYIDEPEKFKAEARSILEFVGSDIHGEEPSYGAECALTLLRYIDRLDASGEFAESDDVREGDLLLNIDTGVMLRAGLGWR